MQRIEDRSEVRAPIQDARARIVVVAMTRVGMQIAFGGQGQRVAKRTAVPVPAGHRLPRIFAQALEQDLHVVSVQRHGSSRSSRRVATRETSASGIHPRWYAASPAAASRAVRP